MGHQSENPLHRWFLLTLGTARNGRRVDPLETVASSSLRRTPDWQSLLEAHQALGCSKLVPAASLSRTGLVGGSRRHCADTFCECFWPQEGGASYALHDGKWEIEARRTTCSSRTIQVVLLRRCYCTITFQITARVQMQMPFQKTVPFRLVKDWSNGTGGESRPKCCDLTIMYSIWKRRSANWNAMRSPEGWSQDVAGALEWKVSSLASDGLGG
jgi:hypothetical protein